MPREYSVFNFIILISILLFSFLLISEKQGEPIGNFTPPASQINIPAIAANEKIYIFGAGKVAKLDSVGITYIHNDYLGSASLETDANRNIASTNTYYPFGAELTTTGTEKYTFTGKELDKTNLQYYGARYYDQDTGRFTQIDPIGPGYAYANNNPMKFIDPTGAEEVNSRMQTIVNNALYAKSGGSNYQAAVDSVTTNFGVSPRRYNGYLDNPGIVSPLLTAYSRLPEKVQGKISLEYFTSAAFAEGYYAYAAMVEGDRGYYVGEFNTQGPLGLDYFVDDIPILESKGYLPDDFNNYRPINVVTTDGDIIPSATFNSPEDALVAFGSMLADRQDRFQNDATSLGIDVSTLSQEQLETWTYTYFTCCADRTPFSLLQEYGPVISRQSAHGAFRNGQRAATTSAVYRNSGYLSHDFTSDDP